MKQYLQSGHQSIRPATIDQLASASGHGLAFERICKDLLNGLPKRRRGQVFTSAQAHGCTFIFEPAGAGPIGLALDHNQLRHPNAGEFE